MSAVEERVEAAQERARWQAAALEAELDPTGAHRRESGIFVMRLEVDYARRSNWPFVLALVEVDERGNVSDGDGRADGATALRALVRTTWSNLGPHDPVVRWGSTEFLCGLVGSSAEEAERRFAIVDQVLRDELGPGIRVGVAELVAGETLPELLARAEIALTSARNRAATDRPTGCWSRDQHLVREPGRAVGRRNGGAAPHSSASFERRSDRP